MWAAKRAEVERTCDLLASLGGRYVVLSDDFYTDLFTGAHLTDPELDDAQWGQPIRTTNEIRAIAESRSLSLVFHPHAEIHVESETQIERFLAATDDRVGLVLDVGHHALCGGDPISFVRRHGDRLAYLHLKSVDAVLERRVHEEGLSFARAVELGLFVEPSAGMIDFAALHDALEEVSFHGFGIVEQNMYPAPLDRLFPIALRTRDCLRRLGFRA